MKIRKSNRGMLFVVGGLVVSITLNVILYTNLLTQQENMEAQQEIKVEDKNKTITELKQKIDELNNDISNNTPEKREKRSQTELEAQQQYKIVASEFVFSFLDYDTNTLEDRRDKLFSIADKALVNRIAPEQTELENNQLSSDPTFTSEVIDSKIFITATDNNTKSSEAIAEVNYNTKSTEGETKVKTLIYMQLIKDEDDSIKVMDYEYIPIN